MTTATIVIISKDERSLDGTLDDLRDHASQVSRDVLVVDASDGRLGDVMARHPEVRWIGYAPPARSRKAVTIPEQRNLGVRSATGDIVVFLDSGCRPQPGWLDALVEPLLDGSETVTVGSFRSVQPSPYDARTFDERHVEEAPTLNMAVTRSVFDEVGGFDESFSYCSDTDFCWRLSDLRHQVRMVASAQVLVDWGGSRRQNRRAWSYGAGRARLYRKHPNRLGSMLRRDPIIVVYPIFLLGLPLTLLVPFYPLLLLIPLWRSRRVHPVRTVLDHLCYGAGAIGQLLRIAT
jgi:glycosyltransferase involved in cell wall biosynthesis